MAEEIVVEPGAHHSSEAGGKNACPVCGRESLEPFIPFEMISDEMKKIIAANEPPGVTVVCPRCVQLFERALNAARAHAVVFEQAGYVLPTPLRMDADERFTGRGVTIAFLDSGFYSHTDLTTPENRILAYKSIVEGDETQLETPDVSSWHGMMTSVVAAGNGALSKGFYRGIAPDSRVVLVKIGRAGRIAEDNIERGLK